MRCPYCGNENPNNVPFCQSCGSPLTGQQPQQFQSQQIQPAPKKSKTGLIIGIVAAATVIIVAVIIAISITQVKKNEAMVESLLAATETTAEVGQPWEDAPADELYLPKDNEYVSEEYPAIVYCTDNINKYIKLRYGPSAAKFKSMSKKADNLKSVIVLSKSINGWTFVEVDGQKGWIPTDYLFNSADDIPTTRRARTGKTTTTTTKTTTTTELGGGYEPINSSDYIVPEPETETSVYPPDESTDPDVTITTDDIEVSTTTDDPFEPIPDPDDPILPDPENPENPVLS